MLKRIIKCLCALIFVNILFMGCQNSILVGSDLLENEIINLGYCDSLKLSSKTIAGDKVLTNIPTVNYQTYFIGSLNDNTFGKVSAEIYLTNNLQINVTPDYHLITDPVTFDSLVLVLQYDTLATYPAGSASHKIELFQLQNKLTANATYYSDTSLVYNPVSVAEKNMEVRPLDSITILSHTTNKIVKLGPQLRIRLNDDFGKALFENDEASAQDSSFSNFIKGFCLKSTPLNNPSIFGFNLGTSALDVQNPLNKLIMYYTVSDTVKKEYQYLINNTTVNHFIHDRTASKVEEFIGTPSLGDSLCFMQAMAGVKTVVSFDDLSFLKDKLINKVQLEISVYDQPGQTGTYYPPLQLIASYKKADGNLELIKDISQVLVQIGAFIDVFGGYVINDGAIKKYQLNITNHIKNTLKDTTNTYNSDLYIGILNESESPRRTVLYGAKHSTYPMKLKVTYTKI